MATRIVIARRLYADVAIQKIYSHPELVSGSFTTDAEINSA
ncbi:MULTISPECIES: hypothetical protein [unclassified Rickettsia]